MEFGDGVVCVYVFVVGIGYLFLTCVLFAWLVRARGRFHSHFRTSILVLKVSWKPCGAQRIPSVM